MKGYIMGRSKLSAYEDHISDKQIARAKRKTIREPIEGVCLGVYEFDGKVEHIIKNLTEIRNKALKLGYTDVYIDVVSDKYYEGSYDFKVIGERLECDADVKTRLAMRLMSREETKEHIASQKSKELAVIEQLAKKHNLTVVKQ